MSSNIQVQRICRHFEDSQTAVLYQNGGEFRRVSMKDAEALHSIITWFINFERPEVQQFRKAIELFKQDIPKVTETIRGIIWRSLSPEIV